VVPLTLVSLVLSVVLRNGTLGFTLMNVILAFLSYIPIVGFITRLVGVLLSLVNIARLRRQSYR
jgi:hypothetical protein